RQARTKPSDGPVIRTARPCECTGMCFRIAIRTLIFPLDAQIFGEWPRTSVVLSASGVAPTVAAGESAQEWFSRPSTLVI
ncbi:MAG: hypothetical protein IJH84_02430, partial [Saccharopolyspora sp.]|uniref:hypothetical protein n=1 Tax=Saccharopolyspora sp. TaxID=33915 RepID=UPI0025F29A5F